MNIAKTYSRQLQNTITQTGEATSESVSKAGTGTVNQARTQRSAEAQMKVGRTANKMLGSIIDIFA